MKKIKESLVFGEVAMAESIRRVIEECDDVFISGITKRHDYEQILEKMIRNAKVITVNYKGKLVGYASMYANNFETKEAYVSMFGIKRDYQGMKFGTFLMDRCCEVAKESGMKTIRLEVLKENTKGYCFYEKYGFRKREENDYSFYMSHELCGDLDELE